MDVFKIEALVDYGENQRSRGGVYNENTNCKWVCSHVRQKSPIERERERDLCMREREVGGCDIIKQSGSEGCDIIKLSGSSSFLKLNLNK